ncbi:propeptide PepSY amd peptidase M4 [Novosphingobium sp. PP1Y]|nr:propeptide PepSY amd peptidase M4 [Novosphingobium sp. PP1Y]
MKILPVAAAIAAVPLAGQAQQAARITKEQAQAIALKAAPGEIVESDYEEEDGGWRYSFDIRQGQRIHEIGVDAVSGKIVEDSYEAPGDAD